MCNASSGISHAGDTSQLTGNSANVAYYPHGSGIVYYNHYDEQFIAVSAHSTAPPADSPRSCASSSNNVNGSTHDDTNVLFVFFVGSTSNYLIRAVEFFLTLIGTAWDELELSARDHDYSTQ